MRFYEFVALNRPKGGSIEIPVTIPGNWPWSPTRVKKIRCIIEYVGSVRPEEGVVVYEPHLHAPSEGIMQYPLEGVIPRVMVSLPESVQWVEFEPPHWTEMDPIFSGEWVFASEVTKTS